MEPPLPDPLPLPAVLEPEPFVVVFDPDPFEPLVLALKPVVPPAVNPPEPLELLLELVERPLEPLEAEVLVPFEPELPFELVVFDPFEPPLVVSLLPLQPAANATAARTRRIRFMFPSKVVCGPAKLAIRTSNERALTMAFRKNFDLQAKESGAP